MSYRVELPVFCGPLDLLLHLVKQQEVDIHDVRIADILDQYLAHLKILEALDLTDLGDFLVMASTLMEIKSREMLPKEEVVLEQELDPRDDLIRRLLEYKRYRDISRRLDRLSRRRSRMTTPVLPVPKELAERPEEQQLLDLDGIDVWALTSAFAQLLEETGQKETSLNIGVDRKNISYYTEHVLQKVRGRNDVTFRELFDPKEGRYGMIGAFIAVLEMMKQGILRAHMGEQPGDIVVAFRGDEALTADQILAGGARIDGERDEGESRADAELGEESATGDELAEG